MEFCMIEEPLRNEAASLLQARAAWDYTMATYYINDYNNAHGSYNDSVVEWVKRNSLHDAIAKQRSAARASAAARKLMGVDQ